jgi:hypothetical protein
MTMDGLASALQREVPPSKRSARRLSDLFWPAATARCRGFTGCRPGGAQGEFLQAASGIAIAGWD